MGEQAIDGESPEKTTIDWDDAPVGHSKRLKRNARRWTAIALAAADEPKTLGQIQRAYWRYRQTGETVDSGTLSMKQAHALTKFAVLWLVRRGYAELGEAPRDGKLRAKVYTITAEGREVSGRVMLGQEEHNRRPHDSQPPGF